MTNCFCNNCVGYSVSTKAKKCKTCNEYLYNPTYVHKSTFKPVRSKIENTYLIKEGKSWCGKCCSVKSVFKFSSSISDRVIRNVCDDCRVKCVYHNVREDFDRIKKCSKCGDSLNVSRKDGLSTYCKDCHRAYRNSLTRNSPFLAIKKNIKRRFRIVFERTNRRKSKSTISMLGCTYEEMFNHLTQNGRIKYDPKIHHIDHICPLSVARDESELNRLNNFKNLRILTKFENLSKHNSITPENLCLELLGREP